MIMKCYNTPEKVPKLGRELKAGTYQELILQLREGELLFGLYDCGAYMTAPCIDGEDDIGQYEAYSRKGRAQHLGFYALDRKEAECNCGIFEDQ